VTSVTEWALSLVPLWGLWLVPLATFLSCLALPVPSSLIMLAAGGFAASGDLVLWQVAAGAFGGAVAGDHAGYALGHRGGRVLDRLARAPARRAALDRAAQQLRRSGPLAVFLTRWLLSPLGPYVNFAGGAARIGLSRFSPADVAGEAVWVGLYVGLGYLFADRMSELGAILGNASGALAAAAVAGLLGLVILRLRAQGG
jgi:membrane-associated protein